MLHWCASDKKKIKIGTSTEIKYKTSKWLVLYFKAYRAPVESHTRQLPTYSKFVRDSFFFHNDGLLHY